MPSHNTYPLCLLSMPTHNAPTMLMPTRAAGVSCRRHEYDLVTLLNDNGFEKGKNDISKVSFVSNGAFRLATQKGRCPEKEGSQKRKATPDFA